MTYPKVLITDEWVLPVSSRGLPMNWMADAKPLLQQFQLIHLILGI